RQVADEDDAVDVGGHELLLLFLQTLLRTHVRPSVLARAVVLARRRRRVLARCARPRALDVPRREVAHDAGGDLQHARALGWRRSGKDGATTGQEAGASVAVGRCRIGTVRRLLTWLSGAVGGIAIYRLLMRRRAPLAVPEPDADPRADELRARLDASRPLVD